MASNNAEVYEKLTATIIAAMEQGVAPWARPWQESGVPQNAATRRAYRGINTLVLWCEAVARGYTSPGWLTWAAAIEHGVVPRKGEHATSIIFWKKIRVRDEEAKDGERTIPLARLYAVFNLDQMADFTEGSLKSRGRWVKGEAANVGAVERLKARLVAPAEGEEHFDAEAEAMVKATGAKIRHGGDSACYSPALDRIDMPPKRSFPAKDRYYATLFHELTHWTGHHSRLGRLGPAFTFDGEPYALEELVAEMGAAFLAQRFHYDVVSQSAAYLSIWLRHAKKDARFLVQSASLAQQATDYLLGQGVEGDDEGEEGEAPSEGQGVGKGGYALAS